MFKYKVWFYGVGEDLNLEWTYIKGISEIYLGTIGTIFYDLNILLGYAYWQRLHIDLEFILIITFTVSLKGSLL